MAAASGWAGFLIVFVEPKKLLAQAFVPVIVVGALAAGYFFSEYGVFLSPEKETNLVLAGTIGASVALFVMLAMQRPDGRRTHDAA